MMKLIDNKKNISHGLFLSCFFLFWIISSTQVTPAQTGYMGKQLEFSLNTQLIPAWYTENMNLEKGVTKFNMWYSPGISYIVSNVTTLGLEYNVGKSRSEETKGWGDVIPGESLRFISEYKVRGFSFTAKFNWDQYAPLGKYFLIRLDRYTYTATYDFMQDIEKHDLISEMLGVGLEFGYTRILADWITISPNISYGLSVGDGGFEGEASYEYIAERKIRELGYIRLGARIGIIAL